MPNDESLMFWSFPPLIISKTHHNMVESSNSLLSKLTYWLLGATIGNQGWPMMNLQCCETFPLQQWVKHIKIWLNHQISYFDWQSFLIIQDGCHMKSNVAANAPCYLCSNFKFFELYEFSNVQNAPSMVITVYGSCTWLMCMYVTDMCVHCPLHLPKKVTKKLKSLASTT